MKTDIIEEIKRFTLASPDNKHPHNGKPIFEEPLIGFADACDPIFKQYQRIIGDFHLTPGEIFETEYGEGSFHNGTVISWILPISSETVAGNRKQTDLPSREWSYTRYYGEIFNNRLAEHMQKFLHDNGYRAVAPQLAKAFRRVEDKTVGIASTWSQRHIAYAAGLGTFSLNDGLITKKGIAHRCGSVVTELILTPENRPYTSPYEYCLYYHNEKCRACIKRCPVNAISEKGHDKQKCNDYVYGEQVLGKLQPEYGVPAVGCGLCQTRVPCEHQKPKLVK